MARDKVPTDANDVSASDGDNDALSAAALAAGHTNGWSPDRVRIHIKTTVLQIFKHNHSTLQVVRLYNFATDDNNSWDGI
jgi:hypothetical protein